MNSNGKADDATTCNYEEKQKNKMFMLEIYLFPFLYIVCLMENNVSSNGALVNVQKFAFLCSGMQRRTHLLLSPF